MKTRNRFFKITVRIVLLFLFLTQYLQAQQQIVVERPVVLMGSVFQITIVAHDSTSELMVVNQHAGIKAVEVDREVFELTKRAITYSEMTNGAFDISIAAMDRIWLFDGTMDSLPTPPRESMTALVKLPRRSER